MKIAPTPLKNAKKKSDDVSCEQPLICCGAEQLKPIAMILPFLNFKIFFHESKIIFYFVVSSVIINNFAKVAQVNHNKSHSLFKSV